MNTTLRYPEIIAWLEKKGIELYGKKFKILEIDHEIIYKLIAYFLKDEQVCDKFNIDLQKGILLTGPIGCGKTSLMNLMKYVAQHDNKFSVKPCRDISFELSRTATKSSTNTASGNSTNPNPEPIASTI